MQVGVYDHVPGDGREFVVADPNSFAIRAEDGRSIAGTDISNFIQNLPRGKDTVNFSTEDASGSTSQVSCLLSHCWASWSHVCVTVIMAGLHV